jgi:hypothetical protein
MLKPHTISFTDRNNSSNAFSKLDVGRALLSFSEFDFSFFWETAIEAGRQAKRTGTLPKVTLDTARAAISKAHPFIYSGRDTVYADIALDCIIEYICRSERMSEDELWLRCITSKIPYETAIFKRISEYKTFRASNEWTNISGLQKYAKDKINFIYDDESTGSEGVKTPGIKTPVKNTSLRVHTLKQYFDLAFSIASNECAVPKNALPSVKVYNPCLAPSAAFSVSSSAAKAVYKRLEEQLALVPDLSGYYKYNTEVLEDRFAVESYAYAKGLTRPHGPEEELFMNALEDVPDKVYIISSLKGIIDLEFDEMSDKGIHLKRCESCGRYFLINATGFAEPYCDRINSSGLTCKALAEQTGVKKPLFVAPEPVYTKPEPVYEEPEPVYQEPEPVYEEPVYDEPQFRMPPPVTAAAPEPVVDKTEFFPELNKLVSIKYSAPKREYSAADIPESVERRCVALYNSIYKRVDKSISEHEFREWSSYLSNMKRNVKTGEGNLPQLIKFLDYSDKLADEIKRAARQKRVISHEPVQRLAEFARLTDNMHSIGNVPFPEFSVTAVATDRDYSKYFGAETPAPAAEVIHAANIAPEAVHELPLQSFGAGDEAGTSAAEIVAGSARGGSPSGNVKLKDLMQVEIDGRKATMANPVWERVKKEED